MNKFHFLKVLGAVAIAHLSLSLIPTDSKNIAASNVIASNLLSPLENLAQKSSKWHEFKYLANNCFVTTHIFLYTDCTAINSDLELERALEQLPYHVSNEKMCRYLDIKMCNQLNRDGLLGPGTIAEMYFRQNIIPCWEDIVRHLCQDFRDNRLAKTVADSHGIQYSQYC